MAATPGITLVNASLGDVRGWEGGGISLHLLVKLVSGDQAACSS